MNSGVSNCIEVLKFWEYSTDLRTNISDRDRIFFEKILSISLWIRIVSNRTTSISVEVYEYCRYLGAIEILSLSALINWAEQRNFFFAPVKSHTGLVSSEIFSIQVEMEEITRAAWL